MDGIPAKIPASEAGVRGGLCGGRGVCGREEDGREEGAAAFGEHQKNLLLFIMNE